jgi:chemotaxis response regulator CheB
MFLTRHVLWGDRSRRRHGTALKVCRCNSAGSTQGHSRSVIMEDFSVIVIGASTGGLTPVRTIAEALPARCKAAIAVTIHVGRYPSFIPDILNWHGKVPADIGRDGEVFNAGRIYVAPPDCHMLLQEPALIRLDRGAKVHGRGLPLTLCLRRLLASMVGGSWAWS